MWLTRYPNPKQKPKTTTVIVVYQARFCDLGSQTLSKCPQTMNQQLCLDTNIVKPNYWVVQLLLFWFWVSSQSHALYLTRAATLVEWPRRHFFARFWISGSNCKFILLVVVLKNLTRRLGSYCFAMRIKINVSGCLHEKTRTGASFTLGWLLNFEFVSRLHDDWVISYLVI